MKGARTQVLLSGRPAKHRLSEMVMPPPAEAQDCPKRAAFIDELLAKRKQREAWRKGAA